MTIYLEMAQRLRAEIDEAEAHIAKLKTALEGLQPLVTMDVDARELKKTPRLGMQLDSKKTADAPLVEEVPADEQTAADAAEPAAPKPKRGRKPRAVVAEESAAVEAPAEAPADAPAKPSAKPARKVRVESGLPSTGGDFWLGVMGKRAHTSADAVERALKHLGVSEEGRAVLSNRFSAWLYSAMKAGKAEQAGMKGKLKRYKLSAASE